MATYVLVHGSYQGGWIWQKVADRLRAAGHKVYAPRPDPRGCRHPAVRRSRPRHPRLGAGALYPTPERDLRAGSQARPLLVAAVEGERHLVHAGPEPRRGASAPLRREAGRQLRDARHRTLPDAEHARGADPAVAGELIGRAPSRPQCRPGESRDPLFSVSESDRWVPAFAGTTVL